jgi:hypothetical protein
MRGAVRLRGYNLSVKLLGVASYAKPTRDYIIIVAFYFCSSLDKKEMLQPVMGKSSLIKSL